MCLCFFLSLLPRVDIFNCIQQPIHNLKVDAMCKSCEGCTLSPDIAVFTPQTSAQISKALPILEYAQWCNFFKKKLCLPPPIPSLMRAQQQGDLIRYLYQIQKKQRTKYDINVKIIKQHIDYIILLHISQLTNHVISIQLDITIKNYILHHNNTNVIQK